MILYAFCKDCISNKPLLAGAVGLSLELAGPTGWFYRDGAGTTATSGLVCKDWVGGWLPSRESRNAQGAVCK